MTQIPRGRDDLYCPLWRKKQSSVCHTCPLWVQLRGKDPQSDQELDSWGCSLMWLPKLLLENAQQSRQNGASADKVATEVNKFHESMVKMNYLAIANNENSRKLLND